MTSTTKRPAHRPRGTASHLISIAPRSDRTDYFLYIGIDLAERWHHPRRVALARAGGAWKMTPYDGENSLPVYYYRSNRPRLVIGEARMETLGLASGQYEAEIRDGAIWF